MQFSQSFLDEIIKFLCSLESPFQVVLKNIPTFYDRTHMTKVMADKSLSTIFFETPCIFSYYFSSVQIGRLLNCFSLYLLSGSLKKLKICEIFLSLGRIKNDKFSKF